MTRSSRKRSLAQSPELLTVIEVAQLLELEVRQVRALIRNGQLETLAGAADPSIGNGLIPKLNVGQLLAAG